jgi:tetratricopeptide (TPR) repeat protein
MPVLMLLVAVSLSFAGGIGLAAGQSSIGAKGGPLPGPNVEGLPEFLKLLVFARQNIAEGDFESALENLQDAKKIHPDDPIMHELFGLAYDGDRNQAAALKSFLKAGKLYFKEGNMDRSWKMLGWMRTINKKDKAVVSFEKQVRKKQLAINQKRTKKKSTPKKKLCP